MIAQPQPLVQRLDTLWVEPGLTFGHDRRLLTVFPLRGEAHGALRYAPLDAALAAGTLEIREADPPSVNLLHVVNMNLELISLYAKEEKVKPVVERATSAAMVSCIMTGTYPFADRRAAGEYRASGNRAREAASGEHT